MTGPGDSGPVAGLAHGLFHDEPLGLSILGLGWAVAYGVFLGMLALASGPAAFPALLGALVVGGIVAYALEVALAHGHNELGLIPFGSVGLAALPFVAGVALWTGIASASAVSVFWLVVFGGSGAFLAWYLVPLFRFVRDRRNTASRAQRVVAALAAGGVFGAFAWAASLGVGNGGVPTPLAWVALALLNGLVAWYIYFRIPEFFLRFLAWLLVRVLFRVDRRGFEQVPDEGAAVIACNHVSFADAVIIMGSCARPIRFVMDHRIFRVPVMSYIFRHSRAIPIAPAREDPAALRKAYDDVAEALAAGELVGIFPEGAITRDGELQRFRRGVQDIVARTPAPVIPMGLSGLWGGIFSRRYAGLARWVPKGFRPRLGLAVGAPVPPDRLDLDALHADVLALRGPVR